MKEQAGTGQADRIAGTYYAQAREYRAETGRFDGRDIIKGYAAAPYTLNEYGYCWNNPMALVDLDGAWPEWEDIDEWIQDIKDKNKDKDGTYTIGLNISATPSFWQFDGTIGISFDWKGNVALQIAGAGGPTIGTPAMGILEYQTITNANSVYALEGMGIQAGGSAAIPIPETPISAILSGDVNFMGDIKEKYPDAIGLTLAAGLGFGRGGEAHIEWGDTQTIVAINIFDVWDIIYKKILKI